MHDLFGILKEKKSINMPYIGMALHYIIQIQHDRSTLSKVVKLSVPKLKAEQTEDIKGKAEQVFFIKYDQLSSKSAKPYALVYDYYAICFDIFSFDSYSVVCFGNDFLFSESVLV